MHWNDQVLSHSGVSSNLNFVMAHWHPLVGGEYMDCTDASHNGQFDYTDSNSNGHYDVGETSEPIMAVNKGDILLNSQTVGRPKNESAQLIGI